MSSCTCRCPKCQPPRLVTRPLGPSVQTLRPSFTAPGLSARHVLLDLHLAVDHRIRAPHLHNTSQKTCRTHSFRHGKVSHHSTHFVDHIDNHSSQNEHTRILVNLVFALGKQGIINVCITAYPFCLVNYFNKLHYSHEKSSTWSVCDHH